MMNSRLRRCIAPLMVGGSVPAWWQPLFVTSGCTSIFLSVDWMQAWLEVYAVDFTGHWVHWKLDGRVVGGCLLLVRVIKVKGVPLRSVFINATGIAAAPTPLAEFNDVLHLPGYKFAISASLTQFVLSKSWSRCFFSGYEEVAFALRSCCLFQRRTWNMNRVLRHM